MKGNENMAKKITRTAALFLSLATTGIMAMVWYLNGVLPDRFYLSEGSEFSCHPYEHLTAECLGQSLSSEREIRLFGVIPVKTATVTEVSTRYLVPCGTPFGLKLLAQGVIVVGFTPIETQSGTYSPAERDGLEVGDTIVAVNQTEISSFEELKEEVAACKGEALTMTVYRDDEQKQVTILPQKELSTESYQIGVWGRDSSAGIGTITFYDHVTGEFGGLGHGVCDADTGTLLPFQSGEVVPVAILDVKKGEAGAPGELQGTFTTRRASGKLEKNTDTGVYGTLNSCPVTDAEPIPVAASYEITEGAATLITTVENDGPKEYEVNIEKVNYGGTGKKDMVIQVTDPELMERTGGIVQGMSGSVLIQNGKIIGAVTHVFVNDPTRGYGIFIENMLQNLSDENEWHAAGF